ncbi:MAG: SMC-Scp complex subunit ScpB, partial [Firmicutes bacterium]|nr:SMC-Scp complex subunit ScpB [Bacillota bacterium]
MTRERIKSALESLLFVWGDPLEAKTAAELFNISAQEMTEIMRELASDYEMRRSGLVIREIDKAFQLATDPENDDFITRLCTPVREKRLSQAALE